MNTNNDNKICKWVWGYLGRVQKYFFSFLHLENKNKNNWKINYYTCANTKKETYKVLGHHYKRGAIKWHIYNTVIHNIVLYIKSLFDPIVDIAKY